MCLSLTQCADKDVIRKRGAISVIIMYEIMNGDQYCNTEKERQNFIKTTEMTEDSPRNQKTEPVGKQTKRFQICRRGRKAYQISPGNCSCQITNFSTLQESRRISAGTLKE